MTEGELHPEDPASGSSRMNAVRVTSLALLALAGLAAILVGAPPPDTVSAQTSSDATLSGISVAGRAIPGFSGSSFFYAVSVGYTVDRPSSPQGTTPAPWSPTSTATTCPSLMPTRHGRAGCRPGRGRHHRESEGHCGRHNHDVDLHRHHHERYSRPSRRPAGPRAAVEDTPLTWTFPRLPRPAMSRATRSR